MAAQTEETVTMAVHPAGSQRLSLKKKVHAKVPDNIHYWHTMPPAIEEKFIIVSTSIIFSYYIFINTSSRKMVLI